MVRQLKKKHFFLCVSSLTRCQILHFKKAYKEKMKYRQVKQSGSQTLELVLLLFYDLSPLLKEISVLTKQAPVCGIHFNSLHYLKFIQISFIVLYYVLRVSCASYVPRREIYCFHLRLGQKPARTAAQFSTGNMFINT